MGGLTYLLYLSFLIAALNHKPCKAYNKEDAEAIFAIHNENKVADISTLSLKYGAINLACLQLIANEQSAGPNLPSKEFVIIKLRKKKI